MIRCNLLVHLTIREDGYDAMFAQRLHEVQVSRTEMLKELLELLAQGEKPIELEKDADDLREDSFSDAEIRQIVALHAEICKYPVIEARVMQILPYDLTRLN